MGEPPSGLLGDDAQCAFEHHCIRLLVHLIAGGGLQRGYTTTWSCCGRMAGPGGEAHAHTKERWSM